MSVKLKGYRKIDKYLTDWCHQHGFMVKCRFSSNFEYDEDKQIIYYSLIVPQLHDELFKSICLSYIPDLLNCDNFILSFFHELGHYITNDDYTDDEWCSYFDFIDKLNKKSKLTKRDYKRYYEYPLELDATRWGCEYIQDHLDEIEKFSTDITNLVKEFYLKNKVELGEYGI